MKNSHLREKFLEYFESDHTLIKLIIEIEKIYSIVLFGGIVRDYLNSNFFVEPRDVDLVLCSSIATNNFEELLYSNYPDNLVNKNQFDGYKLNSTNTIMDIWLLENTWAFKQNLMDVSLENLLHSVCLNIDAYAYHFTEMYFIDNCDKKGLPEKIDFVLQENPNLELNIIRALCFSKKYKIGLSEQLKEKAINIFSKETKTGEKVINLYENIQMKHYNKIVISYDDVAKILFGQNDE